MNAAMTKHIQAMLEHFTTILTNNLISNLNMKSLCVDGVCYYTSCEDGNCNLKHCKYSLMTGTQECEDNSPDKFNFKIQPQRNKILIERITDDTNQPNPSSGNNEDNEISLINKILHK